MQNMSPVTLGETAVIMVGGWGGVGVGFAELKKKDKKNENHRTSENIGSFLAKLTTRVMAGVMILVNSLKTSKSTLSPAEEGTIGPCPISSDWKPEMTLVIETFRCQNVRNSF